MNKGFIMCGNIPVAVFEGRVVTPVIPSLAPLCFRDGGDLEWWLISRAVDRHRTNSRILKRILRISDTSDTNTVMRVHGVTVTDNYWVRLEGEDNLDWEKVRFSANYFSDIALLGDIGSIAREYTQEQLSTPTPELTNLGSFEKCWRLENGVWTLYKTGSEEAFFSEILTMELGERLGFPMAKYALKDGVITSPDFTEGKFNYEPAANLVYEDDDYSLNYDRLRQLKPGLEKEYLDILFMDALVFNVDRHTVNYGVLRDRDTGEVLRMAPNFDNNLALISRGYLPNPKSGANLLIDLFADLLKEKGEHYSIPPLSDEELRDIVVLCAPSLQVDREYVFEFVRSNYLKLRNAIP